MTKLLLLSLLAVSAAGLAARRASAGGMGDVAAHLREMNAICDLQRRGEAPPHPNLCLPEYPPGVAPAEPSRGSR